jgi:hypothetical protein
MWNVKVKVISVITEATGTISKSYTKYLSNIPRKARNQRSAKHSHIGLCTHTAKSTNVKVQNIFHV